MYSCNPPGLPPSWQLSVWEKGLCWRCHFWECCTLTVCVYREEKSAESSWGLQVYQFNHSYFFHQKTAQFNSQWHHPATHGYVFICILYCLSSPFTRVEMDTFINSLFCVEREGCFLFFKQYWSFHRSLLLCLFYCTLTANYCTAMIIYCNGNCFFLIIISTS